MRVAILIVCLLFAGAVSARTQAPPAKEERTQSRVLPPPGSTPAEVWAWDRVQAGRVADFHQREGCSGPLDPRNGEDTRWNGECRQIRAVFIEQVLTRKPWRDALPSQGLRIYGARVTEQLNLLAARVYTAIDLNTSRIEDMVNLDYARFEQLVSFDGVVFESGIDADGLHVGANLFLREGAVVRGGPLRLVGAKVEGDFELDGSTFESGIDADRLHVGVNLFLREGAVVRGGSLRLRGAKVEGSLELSGSTFESGIDADGLHVGANLFLREGAVVRGGPLRLVGAKVEGDLESDGSTFESGINADRLHVGANLFLREGAVVRGGPLRLREAKVEGSLELYGSTFEAGIEADDLHVGANLFLREGAVVRGEPLRLLGAKVEGNLELDGSTFESGIEADSLRVGDDLLLRNATLWVSPRLYGARIGGSLDLSGATLPGIDLTHAAINRLLLAWPGSQRLQWRRGAQLILRNAHATVLLDALDETGRDAWPPNPDDPDDPENPSFIDLQGFTYDRLGGFTRNQPDRRIGRQQEAELIHEQRNEMLRRSAHWYVGWLARDPTFTHQPYQQLAAVFRTAGDPDSADAVLYAGRERERAEAWKTNDYFEAAGLWLLKVTIGYGLGDRMFRILYWIFGLTLLGTLVLSFSSEAWNKGWAWRFWASLDHLLPIVELNKDFADFFDGTPGRLKAWQLHYFAFHALVGYVLASFVVAGLAGLTQAR
jgi:hypothetical protein